MSDLEHAEKKRSRDTPETELECNDGKRPKLEAPLESETKQNVSKDIEFTLPVPSDETAKDIKENTSNVKLVETDLIGVVAELAESKNEKRQSTVLDIKEIEPICGQIEQSDEKMPESSIMNKDVVTIHKKSETDNKNSNEENNVVKEDEKDAKRASVKKEVNILCNGQEDIVQASSKSDSEDQADETSTVKSEGSEKENVDIKKEKSESPDVIMLSDEDDETADTTVRHSRMLKKVKALQNQLRNEEATLVLLKKLRQSQISQPQEPAVTTLPKPQSHHQQLNQQHMRQHGGPPPLVRGGQPNAKTLQTVNQSSHNMRGQQVNNSTASSRTQQGPPPLVMAPRSGNGQGVPSQHHSHSSRGNVPHNMSRGSTSNRSQPQVQQPQQQQAVQRQVPTPQAPPPPPPPPQDTQTPAQRQAAAKQALRKQLEKTLLQIPPPKPPPPEMNFIPSLACPDFILLLGLEEVVNHMIDFQLIARGQKNPDERFVCTPFTCVQCGSDFTPVWKREKPGSKNVICEHCVTSNQKKALKQEHTNRLKSAFVKALQQEQEIERMQASTPTPSPQPVGSSTPQPQLPSAPMISAASAAAAAANAAAAAAVANFRPSAEQLRQHHNFLQAQQVQLRAGQPLGIQAFSRAPFPYNIPFAKQQDLQRQYLLDMIPRGNMPWKQ
ncbi:unnamed protein product [Lymnaea stagnalis]|uniref:Transcriptional repressor p66 coiled-coil MBD2-interaction domain-containing protein n=1 Tax=Lymnaea stagnalis TaxID=6523 RepID=A0AAV2GY52_LYMST